MVDQYLKKWQSDLNSSENFDVVMEQMKLAPMARKVFKERVGTLEYKLTGDTWTAIASIDGLGERTYEYKLGEEITSKGLDGEPLKTKSCFEDGALVEYSMSLTSEVPITITRRVVDGVLQCECKVNETGAKMTYRMTEV
ncbi:fatty acid-binding protein 9-like [Argopecten irradians]|uniref:fatty acid-binding protein 9-like n=1 Tax=Argopecten irradians TaxID=31199 RepID=UPI003712C9F1